MSDWSFTEFRKRCAGAKSQLVNIGKRLVEECFPYVTYIVRKRRKLREAALDADPAATENYVPLSIDELRAMLQDERQRAAATDEKTFKLTLSLSLALTIFGALSPLFLDRISTPQTKAICAIAIIVTVFYSLAGGFVALGAMRTLPSYGFGPTGLPEDAVEERRKLLASSLARNQLVNVARHLRNETAYQSLRNSFVSLFVAIGVFVYAVIAGEASLTLGRRDCAASVCSERAQ